MNDDRAHSFALDLLDDESPASERRLVARTGASVALREDADGRERIEVRDAASRLVFELDPVSGRTVVSVPAGDLTLSAGGDVDIVAGGAVRVRGGELINLAAERGQMTFGDAKLEAGRFAARVDDARMVIDRLETVAATIFESARSVFRKVEDLHQLRAGRARTVVAEGYYVKSGHACIEADAEMKIDGKTIHLG